MPADLACPQPGTYPPAAQLQNEIDVCPETNFEWMGIERTAFHDATEPFLTDPEAKAEILAAVVKRRHKPPKRAVVQGNNPFGRNGKLRCLECRGRKVKVSMIMKHPDSQCIYQSLDHPCERCISNGLMCGREDKVWGKRSQCTPTRAAKISQAVHPSKPSPNYQQDSTCLENALKSFRSNKPESPMLFDPESVVRQVASGQIIQHLIRKYGLHIQSLCVRHAILSCLYRLQINQCAFGKEPALLHLNESYRRTREALGRNETITDVLYAVIFMMFGAMLDDRYAEFYLHALAFNGCLEVLSITNQLQGETNFGALWSAAYAILYYRRPKSLHSMPPEKTWALEDRFLESTRSLIIPFGNHTRSKFLIGWLRIHMYFWSLGKRVEDMAAKWPPRPLTVDFPALELAELARPEMDPGAKQLIGFVDVMAPSEVFAGSTWSQNPDSRF